MCFKKKEMEKDYDFLLGHQENVRVIRESHNLQNWQKWIASAKPTSSSVQKHWTDLQVPTPEHNNLNHPAAKVKSATEQ